MESEDVAKTENTVLINSSIVDKILFMIKRMKDDVG